MKSIRRIHAWLGVLFAPSIVLFALSGMFQMMGCHEGEDGNQPSPVIVRMAQLHMHQTVEMPRRRPPRPQPAAAPEVGRAQAGSAQVARVETPRPPQQREEPPFRPLELFFVVMCLALISSSSLGVWIAFTSKRDQKLHVGLLVAGVVLPVALLVV